MSDLDPDVSDLDPDLSDLDHDLSDLHPDMSDLDPDLSDVDPDLSDVDPDLSDVDPDLSDLDPDLSGLDPDLSYLEPEVSDVRNLPCMGYFCSRGSLPRHLLQEPPGEARPTTWPQPQKQPGTAPCLTASPRTFEPLAAAGEETRKKGKGALHL